MYLEHLNLDVSDLDGSLRFYQAAFPHWKVRGGTEDERHGRARQWLHFGDDYQYLAFNFYKNMQPYQNTDIHRASIGHFAFSVQNLEALETRLQAAGFHRSMDGSPEQHRKNAYYEDPNGFEVEFVEYFSDLPEERNTYPY